VIPVRAIALTTAVVLNPMAIVARIVRVDRAAVARSATALKTTGRDRASTSSTPSQSAASIAILIFVFTGEAGGVFGPRNYRQDEKKRPWHVPKRWWRGKRLRGGERGSEGGKATGCMNSRSGPVR
jgi:hypothetical protein